METLKELHDWALNVKRLDTIDAPDAEVEALLGKLRETHIFTARVAEGASIIRARTELDFDGPNQILFEHQLSYRTDLDNVRKGRCNLDNEAAFYGVLMTDQDKLKANDRITCTSEVSKIKILDEDTKGVEYTTTGIWRVTKPFDVFAFVHDSALNGSNRLMSEMKQEFAQMSRKQEVTNQDKGVFFQEFFSGIFGEPNSPYKVSACLTSMLFNAGCKGILYPSVQTKGLGLNLALPPDTVNNHLQIRNALVEKIYKKRKQVVADIFLECHEVKQTEKGNMLVWREGHSAGKAGLDYLLRPNSNK